MFCFLIVILHLVELHVSTNTKHCSIHLTQKFICLDCGTYCGYSSLVLASTLREIANELQNSISEDQTEETFEFHVYTTEVSSKLINVAQSVFRMAKMEQYITPILMKADGKESFTAVMKQNEVMSIDFLLFDHASTCTYRI